MPQKNLCPECSTEVHDEDEKFCGNDCEIDHLRSAYQTLHDGLSDMIEGGRLTPAVIPDDYQW